MNGNLDEIRALCQDALEDGILMGCDEQQIEFVAWAREAAARPVAAKRPRAEPKRGSND